MTAATPVAALNQFRKHHPEVVVLDLGLSGYGPSTGLDLISKMSAIDATSRIVVLTGHTSDQIALESVQKGATSFLTKPPHLLSLQVLVRDYAKTAAFKRHAIATETNAPLHGFVGKSSAMKNVYQLIRQCAKTNANVLIVGETGTGKELVAQAIHELSPRASKPLSVYFGAAPGSMAEAEPLRLCARCVYRC